MDELIELLRALARHEHSDVSIAEEAAAALEAAREDACVALVADIRLACGDNGKRSHPELVEYIRGLARDAERWREVERRARKDAAYDRYGHGAHWSVGVFSDDSRQTFGETIDAALAATKGEQQ